MKYEKFFYFLSICNVLNISNFTQTFNKNIRVISHRASYIVKYYTYIYKIIFCKINYTKLQWQ